VSKAELGTKRVCPVTGRKFYDLNKDPVISPYTGQVVPITTVTRGRPEPVAKPGPVEEAEAPEAADAEFVSLEDADAEATGGAKAAPVEAADDDDVEIEDEAADDPTFLEEEEDEDEDVTDIIGGEIEDEEET